MLLTKSFDIECPGCAARLKFTLRQSIQRGEAGTVSAVWSSSEMVRCQHCGGVATLRVHVDAAAPSDPQVAVTRFVKLTRG